MLNRQEGTPGIRAYTQQELHDARSLLEQSGTEDQKKKYRKEAEAILLRAIWRDPENKEAKALLQSARALMAFPEKHLRLPAPKEPSHPQKTEEQLRQEKAEEQLRQQQKVEEQLQQQKAEEQLSLQNAEEQLRLLRAEEQLRQQKAEEQLRLKNAEEQLRLQKAEEHSRQRKAEEQLRQQWAEEQLRQKKAAEEQLRQRKAEEQLRQQKAQEQLRQQRAEEQLRLQKAEEQSRLQKVEEQSRPQIPEDIPFVVAAPTPIVKNKKKNLWVKLPFGVIAIVVLAGGLQLITQSPSADPKPLGVPDPRTSADPVVLQPSPVETTPSMPPAPVPVSRAASPVAPTPVPVSRAASPVDQIPDPVSRAASPAPIGAAQPVVPAPPPLTVTTPPTAAVKPAAATAMGKFAVSSPTSADVYMDGRYLGSTPTTLSLPVGKQSLEFRHGNLRTVLTHNIKSNETTTATVTFEITVHINANPWAQIFLDGATRRPLGQTPLSSVTVPIGGVLVFENPKFAAKRYRITDRDTAIQVNFP